MSSGCFFLQTYAAAHRMKLRQRNCFRNPPRRSVAEQRK